MNALEERRLYREDRWQYVGSLMQKSHGIGMAGRKVGWRVDLEDCLWFSFCLFFFLSLFLSLFLPLFISYFLCSSLSLSLSCSLYLLFLSFCL